MRLNKLKIAFQGERGAYSEEAIFNFWKKRVETLPCQSLNLVFEVVEKGLADFGIVPVENSLEGSIGQTYDLLLNSKLKIYGETQLKIRHCLISFKGTSFASIKKVFSHPQALGQCRKFLEKFNWEIVPTYDTAGSVKLIKEKKIKDSAAIASARAAQIYEMAILKKGIETNHKNFTRFFIIGKNILAPSGDDKTSIVFRIRHVPGALFKVLKEFAALDINLTKIESRPIIGKPWEYNFYLDFEGHQKEVKIQKVLKRIKKAVFFLKILGSYPKKV